MDSNNSNVVLITAITASLLAVSAIVYYFSTQSSSKDEKSASKEDTIAPQMKKSKAVEQKATPTAKLSKEILLAVYESVNGQMGQISEQLLMVKQNAQAQIDSGNSEFTMDQIVEYLCNEFETALAEVEQKTYQGLNVKEEDVTQSQDCFESDVDLSNAIQKLKDLYEKLSEPLEPLPEVPAHLTIDETIRVTINLLETMTVAMEKAVDDVKGEHGLNTKESFTTRMQNDENVARLLSDNFVKYDAELKAKLYKDVNASSKEIQAAVMKYQGDHKFNAAMEVATKKQQEKFRELGIMNE